MVSMKNQNNQCKALNLFLFLLDTVDLWWFSVVQSHSDVIHESSCQAVGQRLSCCIKNSDPSCLERKKQKKLTKYVLMYYLCSAAFFHLFLLPTTSACIHSLSRTLCVTIEGGSRGISPCHCHGVPQGKSLLA